MPVFEVISVLLYFDLKSKNVLFLQERIGQYGKKFIIYKFRTMNGNNNKISPIGSFLRKNKIDELPQLLNILKGEMSFVGPRPDIEGYYDKLTGEERKILELKPGLTSESSIIFRNEEELLAKQNNPLKYNDEVLFPEKIRLNLDYYYNRPIFLDLKIILRTLLTLFK